MCETCLFFLVLWLQMESEQLLSLSGSALAQAVSSLLETPGLYVFSDILELPNVKEVSTRPHLMFLLCTEKYVTQPVGRRKPEPNVNSASVGLWLNSKAVSISAFNLFLNSDDPLWSRPCTKWNPTKLFFKREKWKARISQKRSFQVKMIQHLGPVFWSEWEEIYKNAYSTSSYGRI